jgi:4'-phosphopantetheinyl transferase
MRSDPSVPLRSRAARQPALQALGCTALRAGEVQVWELPLDRPPPHAADLLDAAERDRAQRFVHALHRNRYIAAHAWTRRILARHLGCAPQALRFARAAHGKPRLHDSQVQFNLSHCGDVALLALALDTAVGVDVEAVRPDLPDAALAQGVLTAAELHAWQRLPATRRAAAFFACWTRKEACLKALGLGLAFDPRLVHVGIAAQRQQLRYAPFAAGIDLVPLHVRAGHAAALAAVGGITRITLHCTDDFDGRMR